MSTILLVEDDHGAREALSDILREEGFRVETATNGQEALDYLRSAPRPCLILLDLVMPVMDGWEFRERQLQEDRLAGIPVLVLTATAGEGVRELSPGDVLRKPVDFSTLLARVERHCREQAGGAGPPTGSRCWLS
ncbi:MAG TPA: response regulator [Thermoanaerobaculia bacterium]|jgi:CheY-like chemotaxis protein|nr:response regulator [Thermoanaerobaculia bacterium]